MILLLCRCVALHFDRHFLMSVSDVVAVSDSIAIRQSYGKNIFEFVDLLLTLTFRHDMSCTLQAVKASSGRSNLIQNRFTAASQAA